jgi:release factor glutamine methyltransferase
MAERILAAAGIESPRLEAQLLVAHVLCVDRVAVVARTAPNLTALQKQVLFGLLTERTRRIPLAYLRGSQEFYGLTFTVSPATLIPRPETELLVDFALEVLGRTGAGRHPVMVDVGAGSGCISIAVLKNCRGTQSLAIDISAEALEVARNNSIRIGVSDRIRFIQGNLLTSIRENVHLIVSNPPYIASGQIDGLQPEVALYEPRLALDGGADGLEIVREIIESATALLERGGWLAIECARGQAQPVSDLFGIAGLLQVRIVNDLAGIQRMVCGMRSLDA